ncbi:hypothetical protein BhaS171_00043 [Bacillus phage vB_BhaS-171]|uniref:hypothetical protein n=1 Tax=Bacillus phage vB_BhaS-171 TaxID=1775140 RepID=UPI000744A478|nr:hypothetical protein BH781_gp43 [Bacillus phage vB_BhaS-171]ALY08099.1 hypothetical protein BhaS171_00043 [Bacillus phage vB_BhaS-171]
MRLAIEEMQKVQHALLRDVESLNKKISRMEEELEHKKQFIQEIDELIQVADALKEESN